MFSCVLRQCRDPCVSLGDVLRRRPVQVDHRGVVHDGLGRVARFTVSPGWKSPASGRWAGGFRSLSWTARCADGHCLSARQLPIPGRHRAAPGRIRRQPRRAIPVLETSHQTSWSLASRDRQGKTGKGRGSPIRYGRRSRTAARPLVRQFRRRELVCDRRFSRRYGWPNGSGDCNRKTVAGIDSPHAGTSEPARGTAGSLSTFAIVSPVTRS